MTRQRNDRTAGREKIPRNIISPPFRRVLYSADSFGNYQDFEAVPIQNRITICIDGWKRKMASSLLYRKRGGGQRAGTLTIGFRILYFCVAGRRRWQPVIAGPLCCRPSYYWSFLRHSTKRSYHVNTIANPTHIFLPSFSLSWRFTHRRNWSSLFSLTWSSPCKLQCSVIVAEKSQGRKWLTIAKKNRRRFVMGIAYSTPIQTFIVQSRGKNQCCLLYVVTADIVCYFCYVYSVAKCCWPWLIQFVSCINKSESEASFRY